MEKWVIKTDTANHKIITDWFNENSQTGRASYGSYDIGSYYYYPKVNGSSTYHQSTSLNHEYGHELITFEEFKRDILRASNNKLPEKWVVRIETAAQVHLIKSKYTQLPVVPFYIYPTSINSWSYNSYTGGNKMNGYEEITFNEFYTSLNITDMKLEDYFKSDVGIDISIYNNEEFVKLQEYLFSIGYKWLSGQKTPYHTRPYDHIKLQIAWKTISSDNTINKIPSELLEDIIKTDKIRQTVHIFDKDDTFPNNWFIDISKYTAFHKEIQEFLFYKGFYWIRENGNYKILNLDNSYPFLHIDKAGNYNEYCRSTKESLKDEEIELLIDDIVLEDFKNYKKPVQQKQPSFPEKWFIKKVDNEKQWKLVVDYFNKGCGKEIYVIGNLGFFYPNFATGKGFKGGDHSASENNRLDYTTITFEQFQENVLGYVEVLDPIMQQPVTNVYDHIIPAEWYINFPNGVPRKFTKWAKNIPTEWDFDCPNYYYGVKNSALSGCSSDKYWKNKLTWDIVEKYIIDNPLYEIGKEFNTSIKPVIKSFSDFDTINIPREWFITLTEENRSEFREWLNTKKPNNCFAFDIGAFYGYWNNGFCAKSPAYRNKIPSSVKEIPYQDFKKLILNQPSFVLGQEITGMFNKEHTWPQQEEIKSKKAFFENGVKPALDNLEIQVKVMDDKPFKINISTEPSVKIPASEKEIKIKI